MVDGAFGASTAVPDRDHNRDRERGDDRGDNHDRGHDRGHDEIRERGAAEGDSPLNPSVAATPVTGGSRRRGVALRTAIFEAVFEQLKAVGFTNLTMDGVAAAAHTGKAVLYRRWASKDDLVMDALNKALPSPADVTLHGDVRADILALLHCIQAAFDSTKGTAFQVISAEAGCQRGVIRNVVTDRIVEPCVHRIHQVLQQAAERGTVRPEAATLEVARVGPALLIHRSLLDGPSLPDEYLRTVVDDVVMPLVTPTGTAKAHRRRPGRLRPA